MVSDVGAAHPQHVGEVGGDALQQRAVGPQLGGLPAGDVAVAVADQHPHLLHGAAGVHVIAQSLVDGGLPAAETGATQQRDSLSITYSEVRPPQ